jgi:hypothetical protein
MNFLDHFGSESSYYLFSFFGIIINIVLIFLYLKNLKGLLTVIREPNRAMKPDGIWLFFVSIVNNLMNILVSFLDYDSPVINITTVLSYMISIFVVFWHYRIVQAVATSIEAEYDSRSIPIEHKPTLQTGMFMIVAQALVLIHDVPYIGVIGKFAAYGYFIGLILYWVRTWKFKKEIAAMSVSQDEDSLIFKDLL